MELVTVVSCHQPTWHPHHLSLFLAVAQAVSCLALSEDMTACLAAKVPYSCYWAVDTGAAIKVAHVWNCEMGRDGPPMCSHVRWDEMVLPYVHM